MGQSRTELRIDCRILTLHFVIIDVVANGTCENVLQQILNAQSTLEKNRCPSAANVRSTLHDYSFSPLLFIFFTRLRTLAQKNKYASHDTVYSSDHKEFSHELPLSLT